eukprot:TRINITY_DN43995_c0_g1_i1.p1 TRINITY_DN43995_c0_g1~~TRINITY_DN43995_c0_g1_i1.p1  ORF type:complete len:517 (+),score=116.26 TRINITY_DN43995_c0_g1_i1:66-1616(+)
MAPKSRSGGAARSRSSSAGSPKAKAKAKAVAGRGSPSPGPQRANPPQVDPEVQKKEALLRECLADADIACVDGRVLDITVGEARALVENGFNKDLLAKAEARLEEYRSFEIELQKMAEQLRARKTEGLAEQEIENEAFADSIDVRQTLKKKVEGLFDAVGDSDLDIVRAWIKDCCDTSAESDGFAPPPLPIDLEDHQKNTPLSEAACFGEKEIVDLLLQHGAHPNSQNEQGRTPVWRATYNGHEEVVQLLLEKGGDPSIENNQGEPAGKFGTKETQALVKGWDEASTAKNQEGLSQLQRLSKPWPVLLREAVEAGDAQAALLVIGAICASEGSSSSSLLRTVIDVENMVDALWLACTNGHVDLCRALLAAKADVNSCSESGLTCVMIACRKGHTDVLCELLNHRPKTHLRSQQGLLATHYSREPGDGHSVHDILFAHCKKFEDWTTLEEEARQYEGNKACSAEVLDTLGDERMNVGASSKATSALRALPASEIRDGSDRYKQLLEERALADVLGMG